ncbi:MAG: hypothetical protein EAX89_15440 [Candidatus Lokiarchaeota archaeon]|nr:hypothetical protein [Candidatus Lokiarchaeota archaeon]
MIKINIDILMFLILIATGVGVLLILIYHKWLRGLLAKKTDTNKCPYCGYIIKELIAIKERKKYALIFCWECHKIFKLDTEGKEIIKTEFPGITMIREGKEF